MSTYQIPARAFTLADEARAESAANNGRGTGEPDVSELLEGWTPVDLSPVLDGTWTPRRPVLLAPVGDDGLFYRGSINSLYGDSGSGKSLLAAMAVREEVEAGGRVLWIDLEASADETAHRMLTVGLDAELIRSRFHYVSPQNSIGSAVAGYVVMLIRQLGVTMVVIDSSGEAMAVQGINEDRDAEVGPWMRGFVRAITDGEVLTLLIDHATKAADSSLYPSGSKRKRAAWTGAGYLVEARPAFTKESTGWLTLTVAKDRHGTRRQGTKAVRICVEPVDGGLVMSSYPPDEESTGKARTTVSDLGHQIVDVMREMHNEAAEAGLPTRVSMREVIGRVKDAGVRGSSEDKRAAIDWAVRSGLLIETPGPRNARLIEWNPGPQPEVDQLVLGDTP